MPNLLRKPEGHHGRVSHVTPENAGWTYVGFDLHRMKPGEILAAGAPVVIFDASGDAPVAGAVTVPVRPATGMAAVFALLPAAQTLMVGFAAERVENAGTPVRSNKITRSE